MIPENVYAQARELWVNMPKEGAGIDYIARIIMAERERCAAIVRRHVAGVSRVKASYLPVVIVLQDYQETLTSVIEGLDPQVQP